MYTPAEHDRLEGGGWPTRVKVVFRAEGRTGVRGKTPDGTLFSLRIYPQLLGLDSAELDADGRLPDALALKLLDVLADVAEVSSPVPA